ncbi:hypothetical protein KCP73_08375 [Salmonella enterica subsp. enterica]|nr:hypothetical protein KCP73_08375 [Salmonella enterica subsp. enterica]
MKAGEYGLRGAGRQMPAEYQTIASAINTANDPNNVLTFARTTAPPDFYPARWRKSRLPASPAVTRKNAPDDPLLVQAQKLNENKRRRCADKCCMATDGQRPMRKRNGAMTRYALAIDVAIERRVRRRCMLTSQVQYRLPRLPRRRKRKTSGVTGRRIYC